MTDHDTAPPSSLFFSTAALPVRDRLSTWREVFGQTVVRLDIEPAKDTPFQADGAVHVLPGAACATVTATPFRARRTQSLIQGDPCDMTILVTATAPISIAQGGRQVILSAGDAIFLKSAERSDIRTLDKARFTNISVPVDSLAPMLSSFDDLSMTVVPARDEFLTLLLGYVGLLHASHDKASEVLRRISAGHIRDLLAAIAGARQGLAGDERAGIGAARLRAVKADVDAQLCQPGLTIDMIAARHGISPRYIRKLFQDEATSFSDFVLSRRLDRAHRLLVHPGHALQTIACIAHGVGFGDLSYFNRSFRHRYGATPSDVRNGAGGRLKDS